MNKDSQYIAYLRFEKRVSEHTVLAYTTDLEQFADYCSRPDEQALSQVPTEVIRDWLSSLMAAKVSARSVNRKISALKSFFRYHQKIGTITKNPMLTIHAPKTAKRLPEYVEEKQMRELFTADLFSHDFDGARDKAIMDLFYATGMRLSELTNLKFIDVNESDQNVKVLGKRNKERIIPLGPTALNSLHEYQTQREEKFSVLNKEDYIFVTDKGNKMYPKAVYRIVKKYLDMVTTLDKRSPHVLRHTFATHLLNHGADLNDIKELLGHANLAATQIYTHTSVEKLKSIYKQAHPRA